MANMVDGGLRPPVALQGGTMRKLLSSALAGLFCLLCVTAYADSSTEANANQSSTYYFTKEMLVSGGSVSFTNNYTYPWRLGGVQFRFPAGVTNTLTINQMIRAGETNLYAGNTVSTNVFGQVETNWFPQITNTTFTLVTNNIITDTTTLTESVLLDFDDLPQNVYIRGGDVIDLTFTYSGTSFYVFLTGLR